MALWMLRTGTGFSVSTPRPLGHAGRSSATSCIGWSEPMDDDSRHQDGQGNENTRDREANARRFALSPLLGTQDTLPSSSSVRVTIGARTHLGAVRQINEDHYLVVRLGRAQETLATSLPASDVPPTFAESGYAMLVADGLGQDGAGSVASRVALSTIAHLALH